MTLFTLADGRLAFYQWDLGRQLVVHDTTCTEVHFCNGSGEGSLVRPVKDQDDLRVVNVPNILLQETLSITAFAFVEDETGGYTRRAVVFPVRARPKPEDYVYTEEERLTWQSLDERMKKLEEGGAGAVKPEDIQQAVEDYFKDNDVSGLPAITEESEGKYLRVKNGVAVWDDLEIPQQYGLVTYDQTRTITIT
jgi:hypothetical protein